MNAGELLDQLINAKIRYRETLFTIQAQGAVLFRTVRQEYHLTQRQLADAIGVDHTFISKVESGSMRPGTPVLERLARYIEVHHDEHPHSD